MKKTALLSIVVLFLCLACNNKDNLNKDLLIGDWSLSQTSDYPVYSSAITFSADGKYKIVESIQYSANTTIINAGTITGNYLLYGNKIEFATATVELESNTTGSSSASTYGSSIVSSWNWNNDSDQSQLDSAGDVIISGYEPIVWTVTELTETMLKATNSAKETVVYLRN